MFIEKNNDEGRSLCTQLRRCHHLPARLTAPEHPGVSVDSDIAAKDKSRALPDSALPCAGFEGISPEKHGLALQPRSEFFSNPVPLVETPGVGPASSLSPVCEHQDFTRSPPNRFIVINASLNLSPDSSYSSRVFSVLSKPLGTDSLSKRLSDFSLPHIIILHFWESQERVCRP